MGYAPEDRSIDARTAPAEEATARWIHDALRACSTEFDFEAVLVLEAAGEGSRCLWRAGPSISQYHEGAEIDDAASSRLAPQGLPVMTVGCHLIGELRWVSRPMAEPLDERALRTLAGLAQTVAAEIDQTRGALWTTPAERRRQVTATGVMHWLQPSSLVVSARSRREPDRSASPSRPLASCFGIRRPSPRSARPLPFTAWAS